MSWLAPIVVLGVVILVHEAGHFWAAKWFGVYAPRFAIGFGPTLWRRRVGETEYVIGALPLGGYVRMATRDDAATNALEGELNESRGKHEALDPNAMIPFGPKPVPSDRWFESKPFWQRAVILLAGVTMNVVLAVVVSIAIVISYGRPTIHPVLADVVEGRPAALAGLRTGDSVVAVDDKPTPSWADLVEAVSASPGRPVTLRVMRDGSVLTFPVTPEPATDTNPVTGSPRTVGRIGVQAPPITRESIPLGSAVALGTLATWRMGSNVLIVLKGLFTGEVSVSNLAGPVGIVRQSVAIARTGLENLLGLVAFLSINLAILNLVPIPLLDGGQLVMQGVESAVGRPFSDTAREWIARVGLAAIAALFLVVTFNDLKSLVLGWLQ